MVFVLGIFLRTVTVIICVGAVFCVSFSLFSRFLNLFVCLFVCFVLFWVFCLLVFCFVLF